MELRMGTRKAGEICDECPTRLEREGRCSRVGDRHGIINPPKTIDDEMMFQFEKLGRFCAAKPRSILAAELKKQCKQFVPPVRRDAICIGLPNDFICYQFH